MRYIKDFFKNLLIVLIIGLIMAVLIAGPLSSILLAVHINPWCALLLIPTLAVDAALVMTLLENSYK